MPSLYWFDPHCDEAAGRGRPGYAPSRLPRMLAEDLTALPALLASTDDVVLVRRRPSDRFLTRLAADGFGLPSFVEIRVGDEPAPTLPDSLHASPPGHLRPWGWSPDVAALLQALRQRGWSGLGWGDGLRCLYSKAWSVDLLRAFLDSRRADWLCEAEVIGVACDSVAKVEGSLSEMRQRGIPAAVAKAAFGQSGRHQVHLPGARLTADGARLLERLLGNQGTVVVEPWLDRIADLSLQLEVDEPGRATPVGWVHFRTDRRGRYRGAFVRGGTRAMVAAGRRLLTPERRTWLAGELAAHLARHAAGSAYAGPAGIDALLYRAASGTRLKPVVEVNPRFTMGRVARALRRRVHPEATAFWLTLSRREVVACGASGIAALAEELEETHPARLRDGLLAAGALFTTDPWQAREFTTALLVGDSVGSCVRAGGPLAAPLAGWMGIATE